MISGGDIQFVYSGGGNNSDPSLSLGGDPSSQLIPNGINNLFSDVTAEQAETGVTQYRCFYIFNNNETDIFKSTKLFIESQVEGAAEITIGVPINNEVQLITITGSVSGGSLTLAYDDDPFAFNYSSNLTTWAGNLQAAINNLSRLSGVSISASSFVESGVTTYLFEVTFASADGNRYHPLITLVSNNLIGLPTVTPSKLVNGSPINAIAVEIDVDTTAPTGITFESPDEDNPFVLGNLNATEGFPVWVKRETPANTEPTVDDSFTLRYRGSPF